MANRPTFTDINEANAEIRDMEAHMQIMKRMIAVQSERIDNFKTMIELYKEQIKSYKTMRDTQIKLIETWLKALQDDKQGLVMESMDRFIGNNIEHHKVLEAF